ncbi:MAG: Rossmann fold domain-containing protein [Tsuneonella sp.]
MGQAVLRIDWLPARAIDAAGEFHESWLDEAIGKLEEGAEALAIVLLGAAYDHDDWRRAAVRDLAREWAPQRVNMVAGDDEEALAATLAFLAAAPGVTGQLLPTNRREARDAG